MLLGEMDRWLEIAKQGPAAEALLVAGKDDTDTGSGEEGGAGIVQSYCTVVPPWHRRF